MNATHDSALFASAFALIFLAELPDKTAFSTVVMASRGRPAAVFAGVSAAFLVQTLAAVLFGRVLGLVDPRLIHAGAGALFLFFAWKMWTRPPEETPGESSRADSRSALRTAVSSFTVIFLAEWGDFSQLATAALVAHHGRPAIVFLAASSALITVTALAVTLGHQLKSRIHPERISKAAAAVFALAGLYFLLQPLLEKRHV